MVIFVLPKGLPSISGQIQNNNSLFAAHASVLPVFFLAAEIVSKRNGKG
jgi:hypothetical protein